MAARRSFNGGMDYIFSSESVVADASGFSGWEDVKPGKIESDPFIYCS
jgi:amidophosphoribosyltransferase